MAGGLICGYKASTYADRKTSKKARRGGWGEEERSKMEGEEEEAFSWRLISHFSLFL
jgi:hypothetical protein